MNGLYDIEDQRLLDMGFERTTIEDLFGRFENRFWAIVDSKPKDVNPYQMGQLFFKLDHHLYERNPHTLKMLDTPRKFDNIISAQAAMLGIISGTATKGYGDIYLASRYHRKISYKAQLLGEIGTKHITILKFKNEMPISHLPRMTVVQHEKGSKKGELIFKYQNGVLQRNKPSILQIDSKTWYLYDGEWRSNIAEIGSMEAPEGAEKWTKDEMNEEVRKRLWIEYSEYNVPEYIENEIRYAMAVGGAICSDKIIGTENDDISFSSETAEAPGLFSGIIVKDTPELSFTREKWNEFKNLIQSGCINHNISFVKDESDGDLEELNKIESTIKLKNGKDINDL